MKKFIIRDRYRRNLGVLYYNEKKREFAIEINRNIDKIKLPISLAMHANKEEYSLGPDQAMQWVRQRIVPPNRQNIGAILKEGGMAYYDEYLLISRNHGRCAQDSCYIEEVPE